MNDDEPKTSPDMRELASKSVEQARGAVNAALAFAQQASSSIQSATKTGETPQGAAVSRGFGYAQQNIGAIFDFAQKLVRAPDLKQAAELQAEFVREQAAVMQDQVKELRDLKPGETKASDAKPGDAKS
jgi:hypothetical protein